MKNLRARLRSKIRSKGTVQEFAEVNGIRRATLYDFLNGKIDILTCTLDKVLKGVDMGVFEDVPDNLAEVDRVFADGAALKKGDMHHGREVMLCFGCPSSSHQFAVVKDGDSAELIRL